ncbi:OmpH/Skp family outer membrane protein [Ferruginibacter sp.]|nr:OmpH family outer membrane protein [Ferruginibacter sp.]
MNKLSVAINIILVAAIGFLYYYNFSGKTTKEVLSNIPSLSKNKEGYNNQNKIAYVELDSLNENITYFKKRRKELEQLQKQIEAKISNDYRSLENQQNSFIQKNPNATPEQIQSIRAQLAQGQQDIEVEKQKKTQELNQKSFELMESIQKNLKDFLTEYNKEKKYQYILTTGSGIDYLIYKDSTLDITKDVIRGMNEKMKPAVN